MKPNVPLNLTHPGDAEGLAELEKRGVAMSDEAFQEIVRFLEGALQAGVDSVGLEYKGADLLVFYQHGQMGLGAGSIPSNLREAVLREIVQRARLERRSKGKMQATLLGNEYDVLVEEYDSFGQSAFSLTLSKRHGRSTSSP